MGAHKTTTASSIQPGTPPLLLLTSLPPDAGTPTQGEQQLYLVRVPYSLRPPPLYLLHATLLI
jgi:hypothetical protein